MSINRGMDKEEVVHAYSGLLLGHWKEWNSAACSPWMNLESVILSEVNWTAKEKYWITSLICGIQKELKQMNLLIKQKEIHRPRKWTCGCQGEGIVKEFGKAMYTLPYSKWIINKDLVHSTWNSAQCYVPAWMGWGFWRMDTCVCKAEFLCCSPETTTTLLTDYTPIHN